MGMFYADGFHFLRQATAGAELDSDVRQLLQFTSIPNFLRPLLRTFFSAIGQRGMSESISYVREEGNLRT